MVVELAVERLAQDSVDWSQLLFAHLAQQQGALTHN